MANMPPQLSMLYIVTKHGHLECNINVDINICYSHSADLDGLLGKRYSMQRLHCLSA